MIGVTWPVSMRSVGSSKSSLSGYVGNVAIRWLTKRDIALAVMTRSSGPSQ